MNEDLLLNTVIDTVPNWYRSNIGNNVYRIKLNDISVEFASHRAKTPDLQTLYDYMYSKLEKWYDNLPSIPTRTSMKNIGEDIAIEWLGIYSSSVNWRKLISYLEDLSFRSYENSPVSLNLVITEERGTQDITDQGLQKVLDPLASSQQVFIVVDHELRYVSYDQINWSEIKESKGYKFNPEFLQPYSSVLETNQFSVHLTIKGDIAFMNKGGLIAACRRGQWFIYEVRTIKNSFTDILGDYYVGCNIFEIMFDLSYRRHGALLIYDPHHNVVKQIVNEKSVINEANVNMGLAQSMLSNVVRPIALGADCLDNKMLFLELASLDGAIIFDSDKIVAFGAMIESHPDVGSHHGARTTAAYSAYKWGGHPIKISADGDIKVIFRSHSEDGQSTDATLDFM